MCVEFLDRELVKQSMKPKCHIRIQTHRNGPKIHFLIFVDDCIMFANDFCTMFGQLVNFHKSSIQISNNVQGAMKRRLRETLNIHIFNGINGYLGCPITQGRVKRNTCSEVILRFHKKLA